MILYFFGIGYLTILHIVTVFILNDYNSFTKNEWIFSVISWIVSSVTLAIIFMIAFS